MKPGWSTAEIAKTTAVVPNCLITMCRPGPVLIVGQLLVSAGADLQETNLRFLPLTSYS